MRSKKLPIGPFVPPKSLNVKQLLPDAVKLQTRAVVQAADERSPTIRIYQDLIAGALMRSNPRFSRSRKD